MKRILISLLLLLLLLTGCSQPSSPELVIFAAASLEPALTELGTMYMAENSDVNIVFNFDSSGTLLTQIQEGAACDMFLSAGVSQVDALADEITHQTNLLENKVVLAVPDEAPAELLSFEDLRSALSEGSVLLAMGNSDVPVGQYTRKLLLHLGLEEATLARSGCLTYGTNAREVALQVAEGSVDCGIVYATDARSDGLTVVDIATEEMCGKVLYPSAVLSRTTQSDAAQAFLNYLQSDTADAVFSSVGFTPIG